MSGGARSTTDDARWRKHIEENSPDYEGKLAGFFKVLSSIPKKPEIMHVIPGWSAHWAAHAAGHGGGDLDIERPYCRAEGVPFEAKTVYFAESFPRERNVALCVDCLRALLLTDRGAPYRSAKLRRKLQWQENQRRAARDRKSRELRETQARKSARTLAKAV